MRHQFTTGDHVYVLDYNTGKKAIAIIDDIDDANSKVLVYDPETDDMPIWISMCEVRGKV